MNNILKADFVMQLVCKKFNLKSKQLELKEPLDATASFQDIFFNGSLGSNAENVKVFGFCPKKGFIRIECVGNFSKSNYAYTQTIDTNGTPLCDIEGIESYLYFIVNKNGHDDWSGRERKEWDNWTLHPAPNFKEYFLKVKEEELQRWSAIF